MMLDLAALPAPEAKLIVAVSGGRDSMALLHALKTKDYPHLFVCHVDHQLRPDSGEDAAFVADACETFGLPHRIYRRDVTALAAEHKQSLETAARHSRYEAFRECAELTSSPHIVLAHHANDQAETVLFNLLRGSAGLRGMSAITERDGLILHRPLLRTSRDEITQYCISHHIDYREDATNSEPIATRNRLRNEALPLLGEILGRDPTAAINRAAQHDLQLRELDITQWLDPAGRLHLPALRELPLPFQRAILHRFLQLAGTPELSSDLVSRALAMLDVKSSPAITLPGGSQLRRRQSRLFIVPRGDG